MPYDIITMVLCRFQQTLSLTQTHIFSFHTIEEFDASINESSEMPGGVRC